MKNVNFNDLVPKPVTIEGAKDVSARLLISKDDGAANFSMRMFELAAGGHTLFHKHDYEHEVFIVEGNGTLHFEGADQPFSAGNAILVPANKVHQFKNTGNGRLRFLCIISNGDAIPDKMK